MDTPPASVWLLERPPDVDGLQAPAWRVRPLDDLGAARDRHALLVGSVGDGPTAATAVEAVSLGASVAIHLALTGAMRQRFLEDLARLGAQVANGPPGPPPPTPQQAALLDLLAGGATVTDAARQLNVSRRTTNRLLAGARVALGVSSTAEAVRRWAARRGAHPST